MNLSAILHIPMSEYASAVDQKTIVFRLRAARGDLTSCCLLYGDRACRRTPVDFSRAEMAVAASDEIFDYFEVTLESPYRRVCYYFELSDGEKTLLYYGDFFTDRTVDDRHEYYQFPYNHRADICCVPEWVRGAVVYNIFPDSFATSRRFISLSPSEKTHNGEICRGRLGGTINGVRENLDYIAGLGFNCIYINPIFAAGEYHKYDLVDYMHIDPCFGSDDDFRLLVSDAHNRGMRVIIDGVFNHVGWNFFAFADVVKNGRQSKYVDWFYELEFPVIVPPTGREYPGYECFGYERMMPKTNTENPELAEYFLKVCRHWIREYDIDGWRLDVASEVNDGFWRRFRAAAKQEKPDCLLIGEVWETASQWLAGDIFDSTMNYDFRRHCRRFFAEGTIDSLEFSSRVTNMLMRYRPNVLPAQLNLLDSHDVSRFLSLCGGDESRLRCALLFLMTFVGMPCVFYGDEKGIAGLLESEYRAPMRWNRECGLEEFIRRAIRLRIDNPAFTRGWFRTVRADRGSRLYVYSRGCTDSRFTVALNLGSQAEALPEPTGEVVWQQGLCGGSLASLGFAVFKD